ncbi:hypothetical protein [Mycolicibacterium septicum]|uniref:hypothetical protein n=1 Tax=Mycolicibacterium septicum TaxID=98668 RepID=UPI001AF65B6D|nr:hypothetical protein [Mycolicibacterium septicum]QRY49563.1 hypothetical protein JVX95_18495 [Mycolicibacterium septicum]
MTQPAQHRVLADIGGTVVAEQGPLVVVIDRGTGPLATTAFVLGVLAVVFGGFGAVMLAIGRAQMPTWVSGLFLIAGVAFAAATLAAVRRIKANNRRPLADYRPVAVLDRARGVLAEADGTVLAPLDQVRFERRMQLGSSSPKLVASTPNGDRILKRGNPFTGGIGTLDEVLTVVVHGR